MYDNAWIPICIKCSNISLSILSRSGGRVWDNIVIMLKLYDMWYINYDLGIVCNPYITFGMNFIVCTVWPIVFSIQFSDSL